MDSEKTVNNHELNIDDLKKENKQLKELLNQYAKSDPDHAAHLIYTKANKKFLAFIGTISLVLTLFGYISAKNIVDSMQQKIEEKGLSSILEDTRAKVEKTYNEKSEKIIETAIERMIPIVEEKAEEILRERLVYTAQVSLKKSKNVETKQVFEAIEKSYEFAKYFIVGASSPNKSDMYRELDKLHNKIGKNFNTLFPNVKIVQSSGEDGLHLLLIDTDVSLVEAKEIKQKALAWGFRNDAYIKRKL